MRLKCRAIWSLIMLAAACIAAPAGAQAIRVSVTEELSGRPLAGALLDVLDDQGGVAAQGVLSSDGRRVIKLPRPGSYRVRLRRIGFQPFIGAAVTVAGLDMVDVTVHAPDRRVVLNTIKVTGRQCSRDAFDDPGLFALWEAVRTALTTTVLSRADTSLVLEARAFHRTLDDARNVTAELVGLPRTADAKRPYVARPAAELQREGYVRMVHDDMEFYAPDEQVLLSDEFLASHCFEVARGVDAADGLFGVHFSPADTRKVTDISGTLWVDSASAELRYLDFWFEQRGMPPSAHGEDRSGGQVVFERTPGGAWIVSAWRLRMPRLRKRLSGGLGRSLAVTTVVGGYEEVGGVVRTKGTDTVPPPAVLIPYRDLLAPARITGIVYDSLANHPLAGAQVWLVPVEPQAVIDLGLAPKTGRLVVAPMADTTDALGRYTLDSIPSGSYRLGFEHPALDSLGVITTRYDIRLKPGARVVGDLAVPSRTAMSLGCGRPEGMSAQSAGGLVFGVVRAANDQRPLANALVRLSWVELSRSSANMTQTLVAETRTDTNGVYRLCGVPDSIYATVHAAGPHSSTGGVQTTIGPLGIAHVDLRLAEVEEGEPPPAPGTIVGTVTDSLNRPMNSVLVGLDGSTLETHTDQTGKFRLSGVMAGTQTLEVRRVGLEAVRRAVDVTPGATTTVSFKLVKAQLLDAMIVTAERSRRSPQAADAVRRHRTGVGILLTEEQIKERPTIQALLQGLPGVRVATGQAGQFSVMLRRWGGECVARLFIDGRENDYDYLASMTPDELEAVEVFTRAGSAPIFTAGRSMYGRDETCGSLILWLKH
jgi:hypothetical protein